MCRDDIIWRQYCSHVWRRSNRVLNVLLASTSFVFLNLIQGRRDTHHYTKSRFFLQTYSDYSDKMSQREVAFCRCDDRCTWRRLPLRSQLVALKYVVDCQLDDDIKRRKLDQSVSGTTTWIASKGSYSTRRTVANPGGWECIPQHQPLNAGVLCNTLVRWSLIKVAQVQ